MLPADGKRFRVDVLTYDTQDSRYGIVGGDDTANQHPAYCVLVCRVVRPWGTGDDTSFPTNPETIGGAK